MVQPIMASLLGLGFPILETNDPASPVAFAAGPFMLFKASTYLQIGGHRPGCRGGGRSALARAIKAGGHRLRYLLGLDAVDLRMTRLGGLDQELVSGLDRPCALAALVVVVFTVLVVAAVIACSALASAPQSASWWWLMALAGWPSFSSCRCGFGRAAILTAPSILVVMGVGGLLVGAIGPVSIWRPHGTGMDRKGRAQIRVMALFACIFSPSPKCSVSECFF